MNAYVCSNNVTFISVGGNSDTLKKFIIKLNDKIDDPNAKTWDPNLTGGAALQEQWRWTELAAKGKREE